ncbi:hypothetical protein [Devosia sp.]|nr:hypothetical protein [Devosia sp.]MDP2779738.1 hypothetical protein [Devosia sp.]
MAKTGQLRRAIALMLDSGQWNSVGMADKTAIGKGGDADATYRAWGR